VNRPLDQVGLARIFEPEVKERAGVSAALRKRFQPLKAQLRSQVPCPRCSIPDTFCYSEQRKLRT
jgi:hypothetical protein